MKLNLTLIAFLRFLPAIAFVVCLLALDEDNREKGPIIIGLVGLSTVVLSKSFSEQYQTVFGGSSYRKIESIRKLLMYAVPSLSLIYFLARLLS